MQKKYYLVIPTLLLCCFCHSGVSARDENRIALVIGNGDYRFSALPNPVHDAEDMAAALKKCGFSVMKATNASQDEMRDIIRHFGDSITEQSTVIFYYAGHGIQVNGENYIVPIGADVSHEDDVAGGCISVSTVLRKLQRFENNFNVIILDACRDNPFKSSFRSSRKGLAKMDAPPGSIIAYATAPGSTAKDGAGRNGIYTAHLLKYLPTPDIEIARLFRMVRRDVLQTTANRQVPWESSSQIHDFYFVGGGSPAGTVSRPPEAISLPVAAPQDTPEGPRVWFEPAAGIEFVWVPPGRYVMGAASGDRAAEPDEKPCHTVAVAGFWMGRYPVTNEQYRRFDSSHVSGNYEGFSLCAPEQPVVNVCWVEARKFIAWLEKENSGRYTFRLPTEAEWEYACRAGTTTARYWGDDPDAACGYANIADTMLHEAFKHWQSIHRCSDGHVVTAPVGSFRPNAFGLYDMLGNVWQFCEDVYHAEAYAGRAPGGGGACRVIRGGSFYSVPQGVRASNRNMISTAGKDVGVGFRVVRTP